MPELLRAVIPRSADRCLACFCEVQHLRAWVPGLRKARPVRFDDSGLPVEVLFEFGDSLSYSLVYTYDRSARRVSWIPGGGTRDAVSGSAQFAEHPVGCEVAYELEPGRNRNADQRDFGSAQNVLDAFVRWMSSLPP